MCVFQRCGSYVCFRDLDEVEDNEDTRIPLLLIDTAGCDLHELDLPEEISKGNEGKGVTDVICTY